MSNHTPAPWRLSFPTSPESDAKIGIRSEIGYEVIADGLTRANAQHIIECVNAMDGIENPAEWRKKHMDQLADELILTVVLELALEAALPLLESCAATHTNGERIYKQALEALNKAKQQ